LPFKYNLQRYTADSCELCWKEVWLEVDKRKEVTREEDEIYEDVSDAFFAFCEFLDNTARALFTATPGLKPKVIVDNAVAMWIQKEELNEEEEEEEEDTSILFDGEEHAEVAEEMRKRTTVGLYS
jgi:hypothetical protein